MKTIRIFLSSPGDVSAERNLARGVVADLQKRYTGSFLLQPVFWEDLPLGSDLSFQEGIDAVLTAGRGVDVILTAEGGIDVAVFVLWSRLGSPLGPRIHKVDGSAYLSGTEREWDLMLRARKASGGVRPDIFTYIRRDQDSFIETQRGKDQSQLLDMVLQQGKVKDFISEHFVDKETGTNTRAYFSYREPLTFAHRLRTHLRSWLDQRLVDADLAAVTWHPAEQGSPFRGLEAFEYEHAPLFFGREQEVCDIQIRLRQQAGAGCAFVLLVGASGSGKSSLARAGVAPAVAEYDREDGTTEWRRAVFTPGVAHDDLLLGLARALAAPPALPVLAGENLAEIADGLARDPELTWRFKLRPLLTGRRLLLIFDQVEELFTHERITSEARKKLGLALCTLARSGAVWVLATIRSDYYADYQAVPELLALKTEGAQVDLPPPAVAELQRIIAQPARAAGLRFEENERGERLDARLLADAATHPEALPLLEYCLDLLYQEQAKRGDGVLRWADYEAMRAAAAPTVADFSDSSAATVESGLAGALVSQAEKALNSLPAEHQRQCLAAVFSKLLDLSTASERETPVRRTALETELLHNPYERGDDGRNDKELPGARAFLQAFTACRLLVSSVTGGGSGERQRTYTVAHEALLRNWWRLRRLQAEQAEFFRIRRQDERALADWQAAGRDDSFLLAEGLPLQLARKLATGAPELLTASLADYIAQSTARVERLRRRRRRLTAGVIAGLTLLAAGAGVGAWFGFRGKHEAQLQTDIAKKEVHAALLSDLATAHNLLSKGNWREALIYLRRAQHYDDPDNRLASAWLWSEVVYGQNRRDDLPQQLLPHKDTVACAAYSPDGTCIVTACNDHTVQQWDAATGKLIGKPIHHENIVWSVAYSPDGARIVTACEDGTAQQWDAATGGKVGPALKPMLGLVGVVVSAVYSPDGTRIVTACDHTAQQWDAATGGKIGKPLDSGDSIHSVAYSPDGIRIVTACEDKTAQQWDAATGEKVGKTLDNNGDVMWSAAYSPDGTRIVTACNDHNAQQWNAATGEHIGKPMEHGGGLYKAAYSPDGTRIVTACGDHTVQQWDAATGEHIGDPLCHGDRVLDAVYSPDGMCIVTASEDKTAQQWEADGSRPVGEPLRRRETIRGEARNLDVDQFFITCDGKTVQQRETSDRRPVGEPLRHEKTVVKAAYSPDGARIVTVCDDGTVRQWDCLLPSTRPPVWLDDLVQVLAGMHFDDHAELQALPDKERDTLQNTLQTQFAGSARSLDGWEQLARWALAPPRERPYTPNGKQSVLEIAARERDSGQQAGVETALRLVPDLPLAHLALAGFNDYADRADFLRHYEVVRLPPVDVSLRLRAAAMLRTQEQPQLALQVLKEARLAGPAAADWLASLALTRWQAGDRDGAADECQRLLAIDPGFANAAKVQALSLSKVDAAAFDAALVEARHRHPELAP